MRVLTISQLLPAHCGLWQQYQNCPTCTQCPAQINTHCVNVSLMLATIGCETFKFENVTYEGGGGAVEEEELVHVQRRPLEQPSLDWT